MFLVGFIGFAAGCLVTIILKATLLKNKNIDGILHISNAVDKDIYRFEVNHLNEIPTKRYLLIKVDTQK